MTPREFWTTRLITLFHLLTVVVLGSAACGPKIYEHKTLVDPEESTSAELYFFRPSSMVAPFSRTQIQLDGAALFRLDAGSYTKAHIRPGLHTLKIDEVVAIREFLAGRTYFFMIELSRFSGLVGGNVYQYIVSNVGQVEATRLMVELDPADAIAASPQRNRSVMDASMSLFDRAEWVAQDLEAAARSFDNSPVDPQKTEELTHELTKYFEANPGDIKASILLARLAWGRSAEQPRESGSASERRQNNHRLIGMAEAALETSLQLDPENATLWYWRARLNGLEQQESRYRNLQSAMQFAQRAVELDPSEEVFREELALTLMHAGRAQEALEVSSVMAEGQHPLHMLLQDLHDLPIPEGATPPAGGQRFAEEQISRVRHLGYEDLRVRSFRVPMNSEDLNSFYAGHWRDFELFELDKVESQNGGEVRFLSQVLRRRGETFEATVKESDIEKARQKGAVLFLVAEHREVAQGEGTTAADPDSIVVIINYGHQPDFLDE